MFWVIRQIVTNWRVPRCGLATKYIFVKSMSGNASRTWSMPHQFHVSGAEPAVSAESKQ